MNNIASVAQGERMAKLKLTGSMDCQPQIAAGIAAAKAAMVRKPAVNDMFGYMMYAVLDEDRARLGKLQAEQEALYKRRDTFMRTKYPDVPQSSLEYNSIWNETEREALLAIVNAIDALDDKALAEMRRRYPAPEYIPEWMAAVRLYVAEIVQEGRDAVRDLMDANGYSTDDVDKLEERTEIIDAYDGFLHPFIRSVVADVEYELLMWFSTPFLTARAAGGIGRALSVVGYSTGAFGTDAFLLAFGIANDVISHKWEITERPKKPKTPVRRHYTLETVHLSTMKSDVAGLWGRYGAREEMNYITCKKPPAYMTVFLDFAALESDPTLAHVVRALTPYDKLIFFAVASLQAHDQVDATIPEIYTAMGFSGNPGKNTRDAIVQSMEKLTHTSIRFANPAEVAAGLRYADVNTIRTGWDWILPAHGVWIPVGRRRQSWGYHFDRQPAIITIAMARKQITEIPTKLLRPAGNISDDRLAIENVLRDWIIGMKHKKNAKAEMSVSTVFEQAGFDSLDNERMRKKRALAFVEDFLNAWQREAAIKWHWAEGKSEPKICITFPRKRKAIAASASQS